MPPPSGSFRVVVVEQGLEAVERRRKSCLGGSSGFEFLPERLKFSTLVGGKHRKEMGSSPPFLNDFFPPYRFIVEEEIADLDLNQVVDQEHLNDLRKIELSRRGMFGKQEGHQGKVPGMLRGILSARAIQEQGSPFHPFQLVAFQYETDLILQPFRI